VSGREEILARVRAAGSHSVPHPGAHPVPALPATPEAFRAALVTAGGELEGPLGLALLREAAARRAAAWAPTSRVVTTSRAGSLLGPGPWETADPNAPPETFADVALALATGPLAVAENGAVAVLGADVPERSLLHLAERLILLVPAAGLVPDLHSAFRALPGNALDAHHLTWIAGPSKTADIEQTLVHGAHGPRALAVILHNAH
jgi:L-lactate dehydrogenase complex protein LldG